MTQYLDEIKSLVDNIASAGSKVDTEDIILYILNVLPLSYQYFKTAIRTMLTLISLDNLYALLLSEEVNLACNMSRLSSVPDLNVDLVSNCGRGRRNRGCVFQSFNNSTHPTSNASIICQFFFKKGHVAPNCWHHLNP
ncbi:hypothetical protein MA16_Dca017292 [Dendrobium catenatum]|uniref:Retrovirus-related Pol polyprotein from transposon TNT 1-94 n=1 Tax=Dendrobium catenatum TaxID=906689 RepID=A0A2I0XG46_9ASPA|nr:hypothetical protein MA16_Dca017292 [Dendrobium catenatum]